MKIPSSERKLLDFVKDIRHQCESSRVDRVNNGKVYDAYYYQGASDPNNGAPYNRTCVHIDRLSSFLYAPGDVRYSIEFDATEDDAMLARAGVASRYLSREYHRCDVDIVFSQSVGRSLIKGASLVKHLWGREGLEPWLVEPEFFAVYREDIDSLDRQEAFMHTMFITRGQLSAMLEEHPDRDAILRRAERQARKRSDNDENSAGWLHQLIIGGTNPVATSTSSGNTIGRAAVAGAPAPQISPQTEVELMRLDEIWIVDSVREDYTTILLLDNDQIIEGKYRHRNLTGIKEHQPFVKVCPNRVPGYFWGESEVARIMRLQDMLTLRVNDISRIISLQSNPPKAFIGFSGITREKYRALMARGGFVQESTPSAKIEDLTPKLPEQAFQQVQDIAQMFDEQGGFKPIMQGEGEAGVRAGVHARTLLRTASPKLREKALIIERQAEASADICLKLLATKEARVFKSDAGEEFALAQLPDDYRVTVDSHSSSPAFMDDARELAFALAKVGAAGPEDVINLVHPPMEDALIASVRKREAERAAFLKQHPEALTANHGRH